MTTPFSSRRLYTFVDTAYLEGRDAKEVARQLCQGGADLIQLRAKDRPLDQVKALAREVLSVTQPARVPLIINDHLALAQSLGAEGCHLGQEDFFDAGHRQAPSLKAGRGPAILGLSTHSPEQARRALAARPDYIAIGPIYATGTKPTAPPVTLDYVRWAARHVILPWFAIGGINLENLDDVLEAGATRVCVVSAILKAPDIAQACQQFKNRLTSAAS